MKYRLPRKYKKEIDKKNYKIIKKLLNSVTNNIELFEIHIMWLYPKYKKKELIRLYNIKQNEFRRTNK